MRLGQGRIIKGKYRIEKKIYEGRMGVVYICTDIYSGIHCVLKHSLLNSQNDRMNVDKLKGEAQILRTVYPHIVSYIDSFWENNLFYLVIEYIRGSDVGTFFENKPTTEPKVRKLISQKFCPTCGRKVEFDWKVCPYCKTALELVFCSPCRCANPLLSTYCQRCRLPLEDRTVILAREHGFVEVVV